jgi:stearoyl-CoA desaturase (delta-9 desaturase)
VLPKWVTYLIVSGGYLCLQGSPIVWVGVHRLHHQKSDLPGADPHSPLDGFKHALVGWMFNMSDIQSDEELRGQTKDLLKDPVYRWLGSSHTADQATRCLIVSIAFRALILVCFGLSAVVANLAATFIVFWSTQLVNAACHVKSVGAYRNFNTIDQSLNVWWVGILALGEGWHNNHHALPTSARHGIRWWEVDVTWYATWLMEKLGIASKVIRPKQILDSIVKTSLESAESLEKTAQPPLVSVR